MAQSGEGMEHFKNYRDHIPATEGGIGKSTLFRSSALLLGLNELASGAEQAVHSHADQDKFYHVLEGRGSFTVGDDVREMGPGATVWAPAGEPHGVSNPGGERLILLVGIAPAP